MVTPCSLSTFTTRSGTKAWKQDVDHAGHEARVEPRDAADVGEREGQRVAVPVGDLQAARPCPWRPHGSCGRCGGRPSDRPSCPTCRRASGRRRRRPAAQAASTGRLPAACGSRSGLATPPTSADDRLGHRDEVEVGEVGRHHEQLRLRPGGRRSRPRARGRSAGPGSGSRRAGRSRPRGSWTRTTWAAARSPRRPDRCRTRRGGRPPSARPGRGTHRRSSPGRSRRPPSSQSGVAAARASTSSHSVPASSICFPLACVVGRRVSARRSSPISDEASA